MEKIGEENEEGIMAKGVNASTRGDRAPREGDSVVGGGLKGKTERGIEVSPQAYMRDARGFFLGFSSSVGGIVLCCCCSRWPLGEESPAVYYRLVWYL